MSPRLRAILLQKCPRCCLGDVFQGMLKIHQHCPVCKLKFEREQGYFVGAMYVAFGIAAPLLLLVSLSLWLFTGLTLVPIILIAAAISTPLTPLVFRYSRVIWMHMDYAIEPW